MPLPNTTAVYDSLTNAQVPRNQGTWANLSYWSNWNNWINRPATTMTVVSSTQDRGVTGYFNLKTDADVTGNIAYSVYTSNTGAFAGEETVTHITPNTGNISAFFGKYYAVVANVSEPSGAAQLRSLNVTSTNQRFDIQFNDVETSTLTPGPENGGSRVLPLPRVISAVTNMQVTAHNPSLQNAIYMQTGNVGYVLDYNGSVGTTLSSQVAQKSAFTQYMAMAADGETPNVKIYKTTNGTAWTDLGNVIANSVVGVASCISWSYDGGIVVFGSETTSANPSGYIRGYQRSGDTFTKLADPDVWPTGAVNDVAWARTQDDYCAVAHDNSPYITLYKKSGGNYVKENDPATLPTGNANGLAWTAADDFLAVAHNTSPYVTVYNRSGNTFTKLANPASLPTANAIDVAWDPTGRWLIVTFGTSSLASFKIYYRAGTGSSSTLIEVPNPTTRPVLSSGVFSVDWSSSGNAVVLGWSGNLSTANVAGPRWGVYRVSGNTFSWANTTSTLDNVTVEDVDWGNDESQIYITARFTNQSGPGVYAYNFDYETNVATPLTGLTANAGNVFATSTYFVGVNNWIEVANAQPFVGLSGNIRVRNETMSFTTANTSVSPNRLEGITRAVTTTTFGNSTANTHAIGSEVFFITNIDFSARYFAEEPIGISSAYVGTKDRINPTVVVRDAEGQYTDGVVDAVIWALPEQFMDDINLRVR